MEKKKKIEEKWHNATRKNSCSSNQDQMFNAVQWGSTNSQHINSFVQYTFTFVRSSSRCCVAFLWIFFCFFFGTNARLCHRATTILPYSSNFQSPNNWHQHWSCCARTYFQLFFFCLLRVVQQWRTLMWGVEVSWKNRVNFTSMTDKTCWTFCRMRNYVSNLAFFVICRECVTLWLTLLKFGCCSKCTLPTKLTQKKQYFFITRNGCNSIKATNDYFICSAKWIRRENP